VFSVFSKWLNTATGVFWQCTNATPTAAVWTKMQGPQGVKGDTGDKGDSGDQGPVGPNSLGSSTATTLSGILKGANGNVAQAVAGTDYLAPNGSGAALTGITESQVSNLTSDLAACEKTANKGQANGYPGLDSSGHVPTAQLPSAVLGAMEYQGTFDCSGGSYPSSPAKGQYWVCSVAGTISGTAYSVGDWLTYNGSSWNRLDGAQLAQPSNTSPVADGTAAAGTAATFARGDHVHPTDASRAAASDIPAASDALPAMDGTAAAGSATTFARGDHVHPTDTSRLPGGVNTAAGWTATNPTLAAAAVGIESDTQLYKIGDGATAWTSLPYEGQTHVDSGMNNVTLASGTTAWGPYEAGASGGGVHCDSGGSVNCNYVNLTVNGGQGQWLTAGPCHADSGGLVTARYAQAHGPSRAFRLGATTEASGYFSNPGDAQCGRYKLFLQTTDASSHPLMLGGTAGGGSEGNIQALTVPYGTCVWHFYIQIAAWDADAGLGAAFNITGAIAQPGGGAAVLLGTQTKTVYNTNGQTSLTTSSVSVTVPSGATGYNLQINVTGISGHTIKWHAVVHTSELNLCGVEGGGTL
jgi:hypothetical protein